MEDPFIKDAFRPPKEVPKGQAALETYRKYQLKSKRNFKRYGFLILLDRIISSGRNNIVGLTPKQAARKAAIYEELKFIALENANG